MGWLNYRSVVDLRRGTGKPAACIFIMQTSIEMSGIARRPNDTMRSRPPELKNILLERARRVKGVRQRA
jgi:hypothetical protein